MTAMIVAVVVTLLSMVDYHQRCDNHPAISPPADSSSLAGKEGGSNQPRPDRGGRMALSLLLILFLLLFLLFLLLYCRWAILGDENDDRGGARGGSCSGGGSA